METSIGLQSSLWIDNLAKIESGRGHTFVPFYCPVQCAAGLQIEHCVKIPISQNVLRPMQIHLHFFHKIWYNGKKHLKEPVRMDLEYLKQFRGIKEIADIIDEIETLDLLVYQNDWKTVKKHLQKVSQNHAVEKAIYNSVNQTPPPSDQQSAANCRQFLLLLGAEKTAEYLGGN